MEPDWHWESPSSDRVYFFLIYAVLKLPVPSSHRQPIWHSLCVYSGVALPRQYLLRYLSQISRLLQRVNGVL